MHKKKIVVYLSILPEEGGKFQYTINLLEDLSKINKDNFEILACYFNEIWETYLDRFGIKKIKINKKENILYKIILKILKEFSLIHLIRKLNSFVSYVYKQIKKLNADLVFYPGNDSLAYEFDFLSVIPIFDLMHRYENFPEVKDPFIYKSREKHYKNICKYAKAILVDSELGKKHVIESYNIAPNKIHIYRYKPPFYVYNYREIDVIKKYKIPDSFYFYPAQFWMHKNHEKIIDAVKLLKDQGIIVNFVFVGSKKNNYDNIISKINKFELKNQFFILGYVSNDELVSFYKKSQALVMPTFFGPTNIPPLEALSLNCPVVISDIYAHREQLGDAALYFNPNDALDIAEKIKLIKENKNLRVELVKKGKERLKYLSFYNSMNNLCNILDN